MRLSGHTSDIYTNSYYCREHERESMAKSRALVGCGADKANRAKPAKKLYTGPYFSENRRYARNVCDDWVILSAKHHVVQPDEVIEPYDKTLNNMNEDERKEWAARTFEQLLDLDWDGYETAVILAGKNYWQYFEARLSELNAEVEFPISEAGGMGDQMSKAQELVDEEVSTDALDW